MAGRDPHQTICICIVDTVTEHRRRQYLQVTSSPSSGYVTIIIEPHRRRIAAIVLQSASAVSYASSAQAPSASSQDSILHHRQHRLRLYHRQPASSDVLPSGISIVIKLHRTTAATPYRVPLPASSSASLSSPTSSASLYLQHSSSRPTSSSALSLNSNIVQRSTTSIVFSSLSPFSSASPSGPVPPLPETPSSEQHPL